jgi:ubiquinone/menaquinone biosynthesis C-methylase UbiE
VPDVYATIAEAEPAVVERLTDILELRAADPQQREMRETYLSEIDFLPDARVLEVGCGPGPVARELASRPGVGEVVGVDPSPIFRAKGRALAQHLPNLTFVEGDARSLPLEDGSFDVVVFHTTLCLKGVKTALSLRLQPCSTRGRGRRGDRGGGHRRRAIA